MKNHYIVKGKITIIYAYFKNEVREILIDTDQLSLVDSKKGTWMIQKHSNEIEYVRISNGRNKKIALHRLLTNAPNGMQVDHKNHNTLDNRIENLRVVTIQQNLKNKLVVGSNNTSGVRGVGWSKKLKKWRARVYIDGKCVHLGHFSNIEEAKEAVKKAKIASVPDSYEAMFYKLKPGEKGIKSPEDSTSRNLHSPYKNIRLDSSTGKWLVEFHKNKKRIYVGLFSDIEVARKHLIESRVAINENRLTSRQEQ